MDIGLTGLTINHIDWLSLLKKPIVILRLICILFSIIVFGCILSGGTEYAHCLYHDEPNVCNYGVAIGVIAFLAAIAFLITDILSDHMANVQQKRYLVMVDIVFSAFWTFMWFVGFCYLTNKWSNTDPKSLTAWKVPEWKKSNVRGAIAFCFFSIASWAGVVYYAIENYRESSSLGLYANSGDIVGHQVPGSMDGGPDDSPFHKTQPYSDMGGGMPTSNLTGDLSGGGSMPPSSYQAQPGY